MSVSVLQLMKKSAGLKNLIIAMHKTIAGVIL